MLTLITKPLISWLLDHPDTCPLDILEIHLRTAFCEKDKFLTGLEAKILEVL